MYTNTVDIGYAYFANYAIAHLMAFFSNVSFPYSYIDSMQSQNLIFNCTRLHFYIKNQTENVRIKHFT